MMRLLRSSGETGFTLIEVLLAIALMGIIVVGMFAGMATFFRVSALHRSTAAMDAAVLQYTEQMSATPYTTCAQNPLGAYFAAVTPPPGFSYTSTTVGSSVTSTTSTTVAGATTTTVAGATTTTSSTIPGGNFAAPVQFDTTCANETGLQRVSVTILQTKTGPGFGRTQIVRVVKRNPS
jgi:prepilin-type N-terminal cleavage/methylation domain-containing protein